jgi:hypothetical protein
MNITGFMHIDRIKNKRTITRVADAQLRIGTILLENINFETMKVSKIKTFKK